MNRRLACASGLLGLYSLAIPSLFAQERLTPIADHYCSFGSLAVGDFNRDGKPDLAITFACNGFPTGNGVYIALGNGDGTFTVGVSYNTTSPEFLTPGPSAIVVGDFNHDGKLDLAVTNSTANNVAVLLGNGDGTFQAPVDYAVGTGPASLAVADLNGDGRLDLVAANTGSNNVSVLLGRGDGTFQKAVDYPVGAAPSSVAVGAFSGDGRPDLAVADTATNDVSVLIGNGDGTFRAAISVGVGPSPSSIAAADFNRDGKLDLAVANGGSSTVSVLAGNGDGTFQAPVNYIVGSSPAFLTVGDFNGDQRPDLAVLVSSCANYFCGGTLSLLLSQPGGSLQVSSAPQQITPGGLASLAAGDFDQNGIADLAGMTAPSGGLRPAIAVFLDFPARAPIAGGAGYLKLNLVSSTPGQAAHTDPNLLAPWGIAASPESPWWVANSGSGTATLYDGFGKTGSLVVNVPPTPSTTGLGTPTGIVFNPTSDFVVSNGTGSGASRFLFATLDGTISGWSPAADPTHALIAWPGQPGASYTGLGLAGNTNGNFLFAANYGYGSLDIFDASFNQVSSTYDPASEVFGFRPFGIQNINGLLYATFTEIGTGAAVVHVFDTNGKLVSQLIAGGPLDQPWGLALAPADFGAFGGALLVGNMGNGNINAFDPATGVWLGALPDKSGNPIVVPGLLGIGFGNDRSSGKANVLYFTSETGVFGAIYPRGVPLR